MWINDCGKNINVKIPKFTLTMLLKNLDGISNGCQYISKIKGFGEVYWTFRNHGCMCNPCNANKISIVDRYNYVRTIDCPSFRSINKKLFENLYNVEKEWCDSLEDLANCGYTFPTFETWRG
jgi:hypothetical protein